MNPQVVKCFASASPNSFCQLGMTLASEIGHMIAVSVVRLTLAEDTCGCSQIQNTIRITPLFFLISRIASLFNRMKYSFYSKCQKDELKEVLFIYLFIF